jgi:hypothetical protein
LAAGGVGGAEERGAQQRRPGFAHGLALAVGLDGPLALDPGSDIDLAARPMQWR